MGTLRVYGLIDIQQFWPVSSSDADTTKIKLIVGQDSFVYMEEGDEDFSPTSAFEDAISKGQGSKPVINTRKKDGVRTITVRLQGVDAPELHYRAAPLKRTNDVSDVERAKFNSINEERRQNFAQSSTVALTKHLKKYVNDDGFIIAFFESNVDKPFEVVDTYGRFIGNIYVDDGRHDINVWLVENGWGHPAFYTSMTEDEMQIFLNAWKKGKIKAGRTGKSISRNANIFDWDLIYNKPPFTESFKIGDDKGKVLMPKIYRRQVAWMVSKKAKVLTQATKFNSYLKKSPDQLVLLADFLDQGLHAATIYSLHDFVSDDNILSKNPEELIFKEKPGTLVNSRGKKITKW